MRTINQIIIHCAATPEGKAVTTEQIRRMHTAPVAKGGRGWNDIGYHYVIEMDGTIRTGRPEAVIGAHCKGHNQNSIGICYVGGVAADGKTPKDTRTVAQYDAMTRLLKQLKQKYPHATIHAHNEFANKACPSFDVKKYLKTIGLALMTLIITLSMPSCATPKYNAESHTDLTENKVEGKQQSGAESLTQQHSDEHTNTQAHTDSTATSKTNLFVDVTFVPGGGTINPKTGDMSGVASAKLRADIQRLQHTITDQNTQIHHLKDSLSAARDSLNTYMAQSDRHELSDTQEAQDAPSRPFGWKFCITCTVLFWLIVAYKIVRIALKIYTQGRL